MSRTLLFVLSLSVLSLAAQGAAGQPYVDQLNRALPQGSAYIPQVSEGARMKKPSRRSVKRTSGGGGTGIAKNGATSKSVKKESASIEEKKPRSPYPSVGRGTTVGLSSSDTGRFPSVGRGAVSI